jgi:hypothetical protein
MSDNATVGAAAALLGGSDPAPAATPNAPAATPTGLTGVQPRADAGGLQPDIQLPEWVKDWEPEDRGIIEKKGWKDPKDLYKSYRELERTLGHDKIVLPKDDADPKAWDGVYNKLGRPESPDKYIAPKDADPEMFKAIAPQLHEAGLNQKQLEKITEGYNKFAQDAVAKQTQQWLDDQATAQRKLESEWGARTPQEIEHNRRALRALGMSIDEAQGYMRGGSEKFLRLLNMAGHMIAEDNSGDITSDETLGFGRTPNRAAAELQELRGNDAFMARYRKGDPAAKAKYDNLIKITADAGIVRRTINSNLKRGS